MDDAAVSIGQLLRHLETEGHLDPMTVGQVATRIREIDAETPSPWYLKAMVAIGAWISGIFFLSFVACTGLFSHSDDVRLLGGLLLFVWAVVFHRTLRRIEFAVHFALALSVAAHGLVIWVATNQVTGVDGSDWGAAALAALGLCVALYPLYRDAVHRFLTCMLVLGLAAGWAVESEVQFALQAIVAAEAFGMCAVFTSSAVRGSAFGTSLLPLGYALAVALPFTLLGLIPVAAESGMPVWPSNLALVATLAYLIGWAGGWGAWLRSEPTWWALAVTILLGAVSAPGLLAVLALLVLGRTLDDYPLQTLGVVFLPVFLIAFYYTMEIDLLTKSAILVASGAVLLVARYFAGKRPWAREEVG
jgi:hypothetical protein